MISGLLRFIFYIFLFYFIYQVIKLFQAAKKIKAKRKKPATSSSQMMVKDEVCQTYLPLDEALSLTYKGQTYYFCSEKCRQKFLTEAKSKS
ncbi:MAG: hypothetical protein B5M54_03740 [Candidatus Aminicenantes bacterium 4484_214]|nr:MAG: hypothetical protein B5M54_03740 [Candidatus Aminicenantes bacterium 4484_214]HDJ23962.1 YHS domain-containing protein [Candidatus Aminicenantes bacterium]